MGREFLTIPEVAAYLRLSKSWVYDHQDEIPHLKIGGAIRFDKAELEEWLERQRGGQVKPARNKNVTLKHLSLS